MKYKIGDVAKAFCLSKNTLRYYEDKGVILPAHREGSDYRYYDDKQMHQIGSLKKLRNLGLSVEEIKEFFHGVSFDRMQELVDSRLAEEERQLALHRYLADRLREDSARMRDSAAYGRIVRRTLEERYEMRLDSIQNLVEDRDLQRFAPAWFDSVFPVMNIHRLEISDVLAGNAAPCFALSVDARGAELLALNTENPYVVHRPAQDCLNIFHRFASASQGEETVFNYLGQCHELLNRCQAEGLVPEDAFYFNVIFVYTEPGGGTVAFGDLYLPVREA